MSKVGWYVEGEGCIKIIMCIYVKRTLQKKKKNVGIHEKKQFRVGQEVSVGTPLNSPNPNCTPTLHNNITYAYHYNNIIVSI